MTTKLSDLMSEFSEEDIKDVRKRSRAHITAMEDARRLDDFRRAMKKSQSELAAAMSIGQNAVSQLEKRLDIQLSTLSRYVEGLGFHLELTVVARSGERIALKNFKPWENIQSPIAKRKSGAKPVRGTHTKRTV